MFCLCRFVIWWFCFRYIWFAMQLVVCLVWFCGLDLVNVSGLRGCCDTPLGGCGLGCSCVVGCGLVAVGLGVFWCDSCL